MTFAAFPLWAMLGMGAATTAAVVALYLLRRTPRPHVVSSVEFWARAAQSARPKWLASFRIPLLALLMSLLAALLIVTLLGDLRFGSGVRGTTVLVLSAGRTMDAVGLDGERRIDRALLEVRRWVERTTITGEVALVRAGMRPEVLLPITDDAADLERAMASFALDDGPADLESAVELADAILEAHGATASGQILVVADAPLGTVETRAPRVVLPVGTAASTVAITGFSARRVPSAVGEYAVRLEVTAFTADRARARAVIRDGEVTILDEAIELAPRETVTLNAGGFSSARAELIARIEGMSGDGFSLDDRAYAVVEPLERTRVLLASPGNRYLEAALAAHPGLEVDVVEASALRGVSPEVLSRYHALVLDGVSLPPGLEHGAQLVFDPPARGPLELGAPLRAPRITATLASHPALDGLRLDSMRLTGATPIVEAAGDQVLVRSGGNAIAIARQHARGRVVAFGFALADSDIVRSEAFPLLVHSVLRWISERSEATPLPRRLGSGLLADSGQRISPPSGAADVASDTWVPAVAHEGIWHLGDRSIAFGGTELAGPLVAGATGGRFLAQSTLPPLGILIAIALLAVLILEWVMVHRGRQGA